MKKEMTAKEVVVGGGGRKNKAEWRVKKRECVEYVFQAEKKERLDEREKTARGWVRLV